MYAGRSTRSHRPRELRRRVLLPARLRTSAGWSDACILNVSSRGLLINANQTVAQGSNIELRHREHVIIARVIWRNGSRVGLSAEDWVPIDEILILSHSSGLQLTARTCAAVERRNQPRTHDDSRLLGRTIEFASVAIIATTLSLGLYSLVAQALGEPMARIRIALSGG
jgi:PilZ domain-containing protein